MSTDTPISSPETYTTLAELLKKDCVPMETLHTRYHPLLELVRILIGVVPNCDTYLEIWPPAFRTYNIMVPNFLNLPFSVFGLGKAPKDLVGLGMYVSSRAAECPYCSAHTCSFALRRGASPETVAQALVGGENFSNQELATIAVARSLARIPCELTDAERNTLYDLFSPAEVEWLVLGIVMMGFLNKFMDVISVELEAPTVAETKTIMGTEMPLGNAGRAIDPSEKASAPPQTDSMWTKLSVLPHLPGALRLDKQWQKAIPTQWPDVGDFLQKKTGHNFPVLSRLQHPRAIRAIAAMLSENLDQTTTIIGLKTKVLAGIVFATQIQDGALADEIKYLAAQYDVSDQAIKNAQDFAEDTTLSAPDDDQKIAAVLSLTRAASPSPADVTPSVIQHCADSDLSSQAIVELVTWLSVLQMLHRLTRFFVDPERKR